MRIRKPTEFETKVLHGINSFHGQGGLRQSTSAARRLVKLGYASANGHRFYVTTQGIKWLQESDEREQKMHPTSGGLTAADELSKPATTGG